MNNRWKKQNGLRSLTILILPVSLLRKVRLVGKTRIYLVGCPLLHTSSTRLSLVKATSNRFVMKNRRLRLLVRIKALMKQFPLRELIGTAQMQLACVRVRIRNRLKKNFRTKHRNNIPYNKQKQVCPPRLMPGPYHSRGAQHIKFTARKPDPSATGLGSVGTSPVSKAVYKGIAVSTRKVGPEEVNIHPV